MSGPAPMTPASERWFDAAQLATGDSRALARHLLEAAGRLAGAAASALYLRDDGGLHRELAVGSRPFPARLNEAEAAAAGGVELSEGRLLFDRGELRGDEGLLLALSAAARALALEKKLKRQRFEVNYRGVELEALYDVGLAIASTLNLEELSEEILLRAVSLLDARRGALYSISDAGYALNRSFGGEARQLLEHDDPAVRRLLDEERVESQDLMPGAQHLLGVPIEVDAEPRGLLLVGDKESRHGVGPFGAGDRRTLALFANQAAIALENANLHRQALEKERLEREVELAADIQRRLLPDRLPQVAGLELSGWNRPARHVGGDYYDVLPLGGDRLLAVVADVAGKGMPAALMVSTLYSAVHLLVDERQEGPELVERLNAHIFQSSAPNKFITLLLAEVEPRSGAVRCTNAGHNPAIVVRADGSVSELASGGMPLGIFTGSSYEARRLQLAPGDLLCCYSDGVTEAASPEDEEFGPDRLVDLLRRHAAEPLRRIVEEVEAATTRFSCGVPQLDDQTLVLLRKT